jgi:hypothetical protein
MVARIDRLARSIGDLQDVVGPIRARDPSLKATADRHQHQRYCRPVTPGLLRPTALASRPKPERGPRPSGGAAEQRDNNSIESSWVLLRLGFWLSLHAPVSRHAG